QPPVPELGLPAPVPAAGAAGPAIHQPMLSAADARSTAPTTACALRASEDPPTFRIGIKRSLDARPGRPRAVSDSPRPCRAPIRASNRLARLPLLRTLKAPWGGGTG